MMLSLLAVPLLVFDLDISCTGMGMEETAAISRHLPLPGGQLF
jgi:hypothetical protein